MQRLFKQFSFPGGIPSHVAPETPGSIHEGGELGYSLSHAYGAAFDNPDLVVAAVVGDGEAETGPLATSWHSTKFVDPARDGAVLPILHLNGYKIANPTSSPGSPTTSSTLLLRGYGHTPYVVTGDDPGDHAPGLRGHARPLPRRDPRHPAAGSRRRAGPGARPWPMIVLRSPKGWTGPKEVDGSADRGLLALPPGALRRRPRQREPPADPRGVDAQLPTRGAVRRDRGPGPGHRGSCTRRAAADEREPARQRRSAAARPAAPRLPRVRRAGGPSRAPARSRRPGSSARSCGT